MKMNQELLTAFNNSVKKEMETAYQYEAMAIWLRDNALDGMAHWLDVQAKEESEHAHKIKEYIEMRGDKVKLMAISEPKDSYKSALDVFEEVARAEREVSESIVALHKMAQSHGDLGAQLFLNWFVSEQEEEEMNIERVLDKFSLAGIGHDTKSGSALYLLDRELGGR